MIKKKKSKHILCEYVVRCPEDFMDITFPEEISYGMTGGPEYLTSIAQSAGGYEQRNINWFLPRMRYSLNAVTKSREKMEEMNCFFRIVCGRAYAFRFRDWMDYKVCMQKFGESDGVRTIFPLYKEYNFGEKMFKRRITKPRVKDFELFIEYNGEIIKYDESYIIDHYKGFVVLDNAAPAGSVLYASFEFDVATRFDNDYLPIVIEDRDIFTVGEINLIEVK